MPRALVAAMLTDIADVTGTEKTEFIELNFSGGVFRLATAGIDISWNGFAWQAVGGRLSVDGFSETADPDASGNRLILSGVDQSIIAAILGQNYRGRIARIWYAHLDPVTGAVVANPVLMFDGYMNDGFKIDESRGDFGGGTVDVSTKLVARINDLAKVRGIRTNLHSHQVAPVTGASTDTFFQTVPTIPGRKIYWGTKTPYDPYGGPKGTLQPPPITVPGPLTWAR